MEPDRRVQELIIRRWYHPGQLVRVTPNQCTTAVRIENQKCAIIRKAEEPIIVTRSSHLRCHARPAPRRTNSPHFSETATLKSMASLIEQAHRYTTGCIPASLLDLTTHLAGGFVEPTKNSLPTLPSAHVNPTGQTQHTLHLLLPVDVQEFECVRLPPTLACSSGVVLGCSWLCL